MTGGAAAGEQGSGLPGGFRVWAAGACAVHLVAGLLVWEPTLFPGGDNAGYMILGEALRTGAGYVDLHLPDAPVHTQYPPLYPALLAVLGWMGGLQLFKAASLALTTGAVAMTAGLGRRWAGPFVGAAAAVLLALSPVLLDYSHYVLSEAPFVFLVTAALWAADRTTGGPSSVREGGEGAGGSVEAAGGREGTDARWFALALAAGAAAFLTRTAGLPLLVALVALPALRRQGRRTAAAATTAAVVAGGWALAQRLGAPDQAGYLQQLLMVDPYDPAAGTVGAAGLVRRTAGNFWRYVVEVLPGSLAGTRGPAGALAGAGGIVVAGLAVVGWVRRSLRELGAAELFLFLYLGTVSAWPSVWTDRRFLLPALPLVLVYALLGASGLAETAAGGRGGEGGRGDGPGPLRPRGRAGAVAAGLVALAVGAAGLRSLAVRAPDRVRCLASYRAGDPCLAPRQASFHDAARWARENTPEDAVVVNRKPRIFYWISRRRGDLYPYSSDPDVVLSGIEEAGADYVVIDQISGTTARYLVPAVEAHRNRFEVLYAEGQPTTWVLRFTPRPGAALRDGAPPPGVRTPAGAPSTHPTPALALP